MCVRFVVITAFACLTAHLVSAAEANAAEETQTVYRAVGEHGVVEFSDQALPNAEVIELSIRAPSPEALEATSQRLERELALLTFLEDSRRSREDDRRQQRLDEIELARARAELERASASGTEETRGWSRTHYPGAWWPVFPVRPPHHGPDHPKPPDRPDPPRERQVIHKPFPVNN